MSDTGQNNSNIKPTFSFASSGILLNPSAPSFKLNPNVDAFVPKGQDPGASSQVTTSTTTTTTTATTLAAPAVNQQYPSLGSVDQNTVSAINPPAPANLQAVQEYPALGQQGNATTSKSNFVTPSNNNKDAYQDLQLGFTAKAVPLQQGVVSGNDNNNLSSNNAFMNVGSNTGSYNTMQQMGQPLQNAMPQQQFNTLAYPQYNYDMQQQNAGQFQNQNIYLQQTMQNQNIYAYQQQQQDQLLQQQQQYGFTPATNQEITPELQYLAQYYDYAMQNQDYFIQILAFHDPNNLALNSHLIQYGGENKYAYGAYYKWLYQAEEQNPLYRNYIEQYYNSEDYFNEEDQQIYQGGKKKRDKKANKKGGASSVYINDLQQYQRNVKDNQTKKPRNVPKPPPKPSISTYSTKQKNIVSQHEDKEIHEVDQTREPSSIVFIGHVDVGKSTICGNIMFTTEKVDERQIRKYQQEAKNKGRDSWWLAYCMDVNEEERQRGKTVQVGKATFVTQKKRWTVFDAPGHKNYVPNMIMGASNADVAGLVISARINEFEAGFEKGGQTQEHAMLARSLGVSQLIIIINKMDDQSVQWNEKRFNQIKSTLLPFLIKEIGYSEDKMIWIPISGLQGQNISKPLDKSVCDWYDGPHLFKLLDQLPIQNRDNQGPYRVPILDNMKDRGYMAFGKVESGTIKMGQTAFLMPQCMQVKIVNIYNSDEICVGYAKTGENVKLRLAGIQKDEDLHKGQVLCSMKDPIPIAQIVECEITLADLPNEILSQGYSCMLHIHTYAEECQIALMKGVYQEEQDGERVLRKRKVAASGQTILAHVKGRVPIAIEKYETNERLGKFILRDAGKTIGFGKILKYKPLRVVDKKTEGANGKGGNKKENTKTQQTPEEIKKQEQSKTQSKTQGGGKSKQKKEKDGLSGAAAKSEKAAPAAKGNK